MRITTFTLVIGLVLSCNSENKTADAAGGTEEAEFAYLIGYNVLVNADSDDYDIWTIDPVSRQKRNITNHPDVAWTYKALDEGLLFISDRDTCTRCYQLFEMDAYGENIRKLTDFELRDSWMGTRNNGTELIVAPKDKTYGDFYIITRDGVVVDSIKTGLPYANDPEFSPDGQRIVFRGAYSEFKKDSGYLDELFLMNSDGSGLEKLTTYPAADTTALWYNYHAGPPRWHPSGDLITYQSFQNGKYSLYAVSPESRRQWKLTENQYSEGWHDWSPDGKWLTIELFDSAQTQFSIGLMNYETGALEILTDSSFTYQQAPVIVPSYQP